MHTKTPISIQKNGQILNSDGVIIGKLSIPHCYKELPEYIVNCVNSSEGLVDSLKEIREFADTFAYPEIEEKINSALKAAGVMV